jgi:hypothetical protein
MWLSSTPVLAIAAAGVTNFLLLNSTNECHFVWAVEADKRTTVTLYENPTITVNGAARVPVNTHRDSAAATAVTCFSGSTVTANGTFLEAGLLGDAAGGGASGGETRALGEWIGTASEDYLLVVTTTAVNTNLVVKWRFYEEL